MLIGLTGGIAGGKTMVSDYLRLLQIPVIDTDEIARQLTTPDQPAWHSIRCHFGAEYFRTDKSLDRAKLAGKVFNDSDARQLLESILHPLIFAEVDKLVGEFTAQNPPPNLIFVVVPLLFETDSAGRFDATVLVQATVETQRARLMRYRKYTREEADARIAAQMPTAEKARRADYLLNNNGSPDELFMQIDELLVKLSVGEK